MEPDGRTWYLMVFFDWNLGMNFNPNIFGTQKIESWWKLYSNPYYFDGDVEWCRYLTHPVRFYPFGNVIHPKGVGITSFLRGIYTDKSLQVGSSHCITYQIIRCGIYKMGKYRCQSRLYIYECSLVDGIDIACHLSSPEFSSVDLFYRRSFVTHF